MVVPCCIIQPPSGYVSTTQDIFYAARESYRIGFPFTHKNDDFGAISVTDGASYIYRIGFVQCEFLFRPWRLKKVGSLSYYDDDGSEKKTKKMNLRPFKHYRVYLELLNSSNVGGFSTFLRVEFLRVLSMFK